MKFEFLRKPGIDQQYPLTDQKDKVIFSDRHYKIVAITAKHGSSYVAGFDITIQEESERMNPDTQNGLYDDETKALIYMADFILDRYGHNIPAEIKECIKLFIWQLRQRNLFE